MKYNIIKTGSKGNAVICENVLFDCGVSFKALHDHYKNIDLVLLTHCHTDHMNMKTIKRLAEERPTLRFACCEWLADIIEVNNLDILECGKEYDYGAFKVEPIELHHDVPNCGYKVNWGGHKAIYATDTANLDGIEARGFDLYFIESNYTEEELQQRIAEKEENGEFVYEYRVQETHLSKEQADDFILQNITDGEYVYLHEHAEKGEMPK
jgi:phosphoribosyl 1,2-cyclic phosphodiesterase